MIKCAYTNLDGKINHSTQSLEAIKRHGKHKIYEVVAASPTMMPYSKFLK
jgi:hypothetical protein